MKKLLLIPLVLVGMAFGLAGCDSPANVASRNLSTAADNFEIARRVVFYNGITGAYMLDIEGLCSLGNNDSPKEVTVTCKVGPGEFKKHFLGLSDNVTYFVEQLYPKAVSTFQYRVFFRPQEIIPDFDFQFKGGELIRPTRPSADAPVDSVKQGSPG